MKVFFPAVEFSDADIDVHALVIEILYSRRDFLYVIVKIF